MMQTKNLAENKIPSNTIRGVINSMKRLADTPLPRINVYKGKIVDPSAQRQKDMMTMLARIMMLIESDEQSKSSRNTVSLFQIEDRIG